MKLVTIDWLIIAAYFVMSLLIGLYYARRAGQSTEEYFVADRSMPWWLAGTSMVATTFAADTPLAVTEMVARNGVAGNWLWWSMLASGMLTVFFFARLWRRARVMTDVEFVELRYSGKPAAFLRGFRALYLGLPINLIIMGWVNLGMAKVLSGTLGLAKWQALALCLGITFIYSILSGFWGVVVTDAVQFVIAMAGSIALAVFAVNAVGGLESLKARLAGVTPVGSAEPFGPGGAIQLLPDGSAVWMLPLLTLAVYLGVNWWASWYPGAEPGGGGYVAQRIFSAKNEKHGLLATLWFNIAHYALRPWPWIIVALCSLVLYNGTTLNPETGKPDAAFGYVQVMNDYLPIGFRGLLLASFAAAYMSTIATQMNWGASYIINDFYRRFVKPEASEKHYVFASRMATLIIVLLSIVVTYYMNQITSGWELVMVLGAGTGLVYILRWYWWRVNAWSEVAAMSSALVVSLGLRQLSSLLKSADLNNGSSWDPYAATVLSFIDPGTPKGFAGQILITVGITTIAWLVATFVTRPEPMEKLISFYRNVHPAGSLWRPVARASGIPERTGEVWPNAVNWLLGIVLVYSTLFGIGEIIFGTWPRVLLFVLIAAGSGAIMMWNLNRTGWAGLAESAERRVGDIVAEGAD
ncbi:MAG TPA: sodium:solute symporter family protein [Pyrinomonadaceae bacterium]|nr:sodium:solute symporter family protein [Pyrinomonadaceae bacterium]